MAMAPTDPEIAHLKRLRQWRSLRDKDLSLGFLQPYFQRNIARPFKQLESVVPVWQRLVPEELQSHARLESLRRGVLHVAVDSSAHLYELDRLLRSGLERQLISQYKGYGLSRVQLRIVRESA